MSECGVSECGVSEGDREYSTVRNWPSIGCCVMGRKNHFTCQNLIFDYASSLSSVNPILV